MPAPRALVTGGTGFIGSHLVDRLARDGVDVRVLARGDRELPGATIVRGDMRDPDSLAKAVEGVDAVFHLASLITEGALGEEAYREVNVGGTGRLLDAAIRGGVKRFVFTSSMNVYPPVASEPLDESSPTGPDEILGRTKLEAEALIRARCSAAGVEFSIIRPPRVYGPRDQSLLRLFRLIERGLFFMIGDGKGMMHPIHVDDLVEAIVLASRHPAAAGETFVVAGPERHTKREFCGAVAVALGRKLPRRRIPKKLAVAAAVACERAFKLIGAEPPISTRRIRFFMTSQVCRIDKIRDRIGFTPRVTAREGLASTVSWYRSEKWL